MVQLWGQAGSTVVGGRRGQEGVPEDPQQGVCKIDGGHCDAAQVTNNGKEEVGGLSLNSARKLKQLFKKLLLTVEPFAAVFAEDGIKEPLVRRVATRAQRVACDTTQVVSQAHHGGNLLSQATAVLPTGTAMLRWSRQPASPMPSMCWRCTQAGFWERGRQCRRCGQLNTCTSGTTNGCVAEPCTACHSW